MKCTVTAVGHLIKTPGDTCTQVRELHVEDTVIAILYAQGQTGN